MKIITNDDYKNISSVNELLKPYNKTVILYRTSNNYGHWVCIWKHGGVINFFDSYGTFPDDQRKHIPISYRNLMQTNKPYLIKLLLSCGCPMRYNEKRLQNKTTHTCGRWVIDRLRHPHLNEYEYYNLFRNHKNKDDKIIEHTWDV